jgi:penicillin-binding protein 1A
VNYIKSTPPNQLNLILNQNPYIDGDATYFRMEVGKEVSQIIRKMDLQKSDGSLYDIYRDGLKIYTSIDIDMQRIARETMLKHMKTVQANFWREWKEKTLNIMQTKVSLPFAMLP